MLLLLPHADAAVTRIESDCCCSLEDSNLYFLFLLGFDSPNDDDDGDGRGGGGGEAENRKEIAIYHREKVDLFCLGTALKELFYGIIFCFLNTTEAF